MDAKNLRDLAETALVGDGFAVADDTPNLPTPAVDPGGAVLFIQHNKVRLYLVPRKQGLLSKSADAAARALARVGIRAVDVGADPATAPTQSNEVLETATGELGIGVDPSIGPFGESSRDHFDRLRRSRDRLRAAGVNGTVGSDTARDALFHFFQDAYHLKDWLKNDQRLSISPQEIDDLEDHVRATPALSICADISNGTKHLKLDKPKVQGKPAVLSSQSVTIGLPTFTVAAEFPGSPVREARQPAPVTATHTWTITFDGQQYDALDLTDEVIAAWTSYMQARNWM